MASKIATHGVLWRAVRFGRTGVHTEFMEATAAEPVTVMYVNMYMFSSPETVSDTRKNLTVHVARFRSEGVDAEPVVFGDHRRPEAVLLPFAMFQLLLDVAEDIVLAQRVRERAVADTGERSTLADAATRFGIDLDTL